MRWPGAARLGGVALLAGMAMHNAAAQDAAPAMAAEPDATIPAAAQEPVMRPNVEPFPTLPPSRACGKEDVVGLWKLSHVYEVPLAAESAALFNSPIQYINFHGNSTYGLYAGRKDLPAGQEALIIDQMKEPLHQFVVDKTGFIYFYREGIVIDTKACFTVATTTPSFTAGEMLLMPPQGQSRVRMVKVYNKVVAGAVVAPKRGALIRTIMPPTTALDRIIPPPVDVQPPPATE
jgi:hypothetical protein